MKNLPYLTHQDTFQITKNLHPNKEVSEERIDTEKNNVVEESEEYIIEPSSDELDDEPLGRLRHRANKVEPDNRRQATRRRLGLDMCHKRWLTYTRR